MTTQETTDPLGAYLFARIEQEFEKQFRRHALPPAMACDRPASAPAPPYSADAGHPAQSD